MYMLSFFVGVGQDANGTTVTDAKRECGLAIIRAMLAKEFGGYTEMQANGGWVNEAGELVTEPSVVFMCVASSAEEPYEMAREFATVMNQSAVLFTSQELRHAIFAEQRSKAHV